MKAEDFKIKKLTRNTRSFRKRLSKELRAHTQAKAGPFHFKEFSLSLMGKGGKWAGGLIGCTYWNSLFIDVLWVDRKYRGLGLGRQLVEWAEREARKKNCTLAHLSTHSLQSPGFYRRLGYKVFGQLKGYPKKTSAYYFFKKL